MLPSVKTERATLACDSEDDKRGAYRKTPKEAGTVRLHARSAKQKATQRRSPVAGVTDTIVVDSAKAMVLRHSHETIQWHPTYADFTRYYGVRPWAGASGR